ncbi:MAG: mismatch-specific DNA-glycosylase [Pseudomonadota bacterium]
MAVLPDVLAENLDVVFCGTAPGAYSAQVGAYYAKPGNRFWPTLHQVGLTPARLAPQQYRQVLNWNLGLTDLAKSTSGQDAILKKTDFEPRALRRIVTRFHPRIIAFTSKRAAMEYFGYDVDYGLQASGIGDTRLFVLTSPSGLATRYWQNARHWRDLAAQVRTFKE